MPNMPPTHRRGGAAVPVHRYEDERKSARERGYDSRWEKAAKAFRLAHPLCRYCELDDVTSASELVDHLYPHRGDKVLFWRREYWVPSCAHCHDGFKQVIERRGRSALDDLACRLGLKPLG